MYRQFIFCLTTVSFLYSLTLFSVAFFLAFSLATVPKAFATQTLSYSSALEQAKSNSPQLLKMEAAKDEAGWKNAEGASVFLPTVRVLGHHYFAKRYEYLDLDFGGAPITFPQIFPSSAGTMEGNWLLFDGLANVNTFRSTSKIKSAGEHDYEWAKFQLEQDVRLAYAKVVAAKKLNDVAQQNLKTLENHLTQVKALKTGGVATNYDVLRVEAQFSEGQTELLQSEDNIQISQERLAQVLGLNEPVDASEMDLEIPSSVQKVKGLTFSPESNKRLDLEALQERVYASDLQSSAASAFWVPKLSLIGQYTMYNNITDNLGDWDKYRASWRAGFFLNWEIFNPKEIAQSKEEKYRVIQNEKSLQAANQSAPVDFAFWKKRYIYSAALYEAKKIDHDRAQETLRLAAAGFKAGVRTTVDVIDAELELFRARAGIVTAQLNCIESKIKLELSQGERI
jgi:outer membrane protein TolC